VYLKNKNECFILQRKMKRFIFIILFLIPFGVFSFCHHKWQKTASGIYYKVYSKDTSKAKPIYGDHICMHLRKYSTKKKEIFNTRIFDAQKGVEMDYKKPEKTSDVTEIFSFLGRGDSAFVKIPANLIDSNGSKKKYYTFWLNLIDFKTKEIHTLEKKERYEQQLVLDSLAILDYIKNYDLHQCTQDEYGNWYLVKQHGSEKLVKSGDSVTIHYSGKLTNGKEFDNSYDRKQPFKFMVGKKQVIDGLDKGIQHFYVGDKCILIIPSRLGYGDKEVGRIPANSVLIFEMEILE
jgi:FKBP-type peptidyl-prolyl cis-trans isomerase FkpA